jgi:hypothetical protein
MRKTKADLEAEIVMLREQVKVCEYLLDSETAHRKALEPVHKVDVEKTVKRDTKKVRKVVKALERKKYLRLRYAEYRKTHNKTESRKKANDDMAKEFGENYRLSLKKDGNPGRQLMEICKD